MKTRRWWALLKWYCTSIDSDTMVALRTPLFQIGWCFWNPRPDRGRIEYGWFIGLWPTFPDVGGFAYRWDWERMDHWPLQRRAFKFHPVGSELHRQYMEGFKTSSGGLL